MGMPKGTKVKVSTYVEGAAMQELRAEADRTGDSVCKLIGDAVGKRKASRGAESLAKAVVAMQLALQRAEVSEDAMDVLMTRQWLDAVELAQEIAL